MDNTVIGHNGSPGKACNEDDKVTKHATRRSHVIAAMLTTWLALGSMNVRATEGAAVDGMSLASQRQCLGCHQVDARRVGPPFRAIAERFQGRAEAAGILARAMREGSKGQWGAIPMPAQTRLSDTDAQRLALWILSLKDASASKP
jgi:cytochrome c